MYLSDQIPYYVTYNLAFMTFIEQLNSHSVDMGMSSELVLGL